MDSYQNPSIMVPCPRSYGIKVNSPFSKKLHDGKGIYTDPLTGQVMASQRLNWLVHKGDLLMANETREIETELVGVFRANDSRCFPVSVLEYLDDDVPNRYQTAHEGTFSVLYFHGKVERETYD